MVEPRLPVTRRGHGRCAVGCAGRVEAVLGRRQRRDDRTQILTAYLQGWQALPRQAFPQGIFKNYTKYYHPDPALRQEAI